MKPFILVGDAVNIMKTYRYEHGTRKGPIIERE